MRFLRIFGFLLFLVPTVSFAANNDFMVAAQLLAAAKNADIQQVQVLINNGANVNYVDSTGLSLVCTALMNNDVRAAQILQMYGADASKCDRQIKQYNSKSKPTGGGGLFGGLSSAQSITLTAAGAAVIVGGLFLLTDVFDPGNDNDSSSSTGVHGGGNNDNGATNATVAFTTPDGPASLDTDYNYTTALDLYSPSDTDSILSKNFDLMTNTYKQNYLLMMHGYSAFARGYMGMSTLRNKSTNAPLNIGGNNLGTEPVLGGRPINVALVTANGINAVDDTALADKFLPWTTLNDNGTTVNGASNDMISSKYYNNTIAYGTNTESLGDDTVTEDTTLVSTFDLSGNGTAIHNTSASDMDNLLAKVVAGSITTGATADYMGFMPNGQLTIFRTGGGKDNNDDTIDYGNYRALLSGAVLYANGDTTMGRSRPNILANASVIEPMYATDAADMDDLLSINASSSEDYQNEYSKLVNKYYNADPTANTQGAFAKTFFSGLGSSYSPIVMFSTGAVETDSDYSGRAYTATFENSAPLVYGTNMEHLFASIVAVGQKGTGTNGTTTVSGYSPANKYILTQWQDTNGTTDNTSDDTYYRARMCGIAGTGAGGIDPWCFAATGLTDELAVASAAGAFGAVKSAFSYLTNQQIFALMALTADGAYLGTNNSGTSFTTDSLTSYLQGLYELPNEYQYQVNAGTMDYLDAFKQVFGYGLINVERATTPGKNVFYYNGTDIVSTAGNAYWRAASNTAFRSSSAFGARGATLKTSAFDVLTSVDGKLSLPRIWTNEFALGTNSRHGLYMGDVLGELKTRDAEPNRMQIGNVGFSMTTSPRAYNDNMGGLDNMRIDWSMGNWNVAAGYQRYLTDGVSRFTGLSNPILNLASNAVVSDATYDFGNWSFGARAFSGNITDESLLEHDPTIAANYAPARLGFVRGGGANIGLRGKYFGFNSAIGFANETNTLLGAYTNGLLNMGAGDTVYMDNELRVRPVDKVTLTARATFARTTTDGAGDMILGVSPLESNAFAVGAEFGNLKLSVAQPLAVRRGSLRYAYADYDIVDGADGKFALDVKDAHVAEIDLGARTRELRFGAEYRHSFGTFTDGAFGFIYRVNPNNTDEFGNESIFMLKLTHRVGI